MEQNKFITPPPMSAFNTIMPQPELRQQGFHVPSTSTYHPGMEFLPGQRFPSSKMAPQVHANSFTPNQGYGNRSTTTHGLPYSSFKPQMDSYGHGPSVPPGCHPYPNMTNAMPMRTNGSHQSNDTHNVHPHSPTVSQENGTTYFQNSIHPNGIHPHHHPFDPRPQMSGIRPLYSNPDSDNKKKVKDSFFMDEEIRTMLLNQQMISQLSLVDNENPARYPAEIDTYHQLFPLENTDQKSATLNPIVTSTFRVNHRDGLQYCMKRIHACRNVSKSGLQTLDKWKSLRHSNIVTLHEVFTTKAFQDQSLVFIYDFHPSTDTLMDIIFRSPSWKSKGELMTIKQKVLPKEQTIWTYVVQLTSAIRQIHSTGLAYRSLDLTKILLTGKNRIRLGSIGIKDLLSGCPEDINRFQQQDLIDLGHVILSIASNTVMACQSDNIVGKALEVVQKKYSKDLHSIITYLIFGPNPVGIQMNRNRSVNDLMPLIGARFYTMIDDALLRGDETERELSTGLENGRLFRLMCKLGAVDRNDFGHEYETGDRYLLKLFRNHLFHQINENGSPWLDMSHIVHNLNKLDIGSCERFLLTSHDNENVLVVSYADIQNAVTKCFQELLDSR